MTLAAVVDLILELSENADLDRTSAFGRLLPFLTGRNWPILACHEGQKTTQS